MLTQQPMPYSPAASVLAMNDTIHYWLLGCRQLPCIMPLVVMGQIATLQIPHPMFVLPTSGARLLTQQPISCSPAASVLATNHTIHYCLQGCRQLPCTVPLVVMGQVAILQIPHQIFVPLPPTSVARMLTQ